MGNRRWNRGQLEVAQEAGHHRLLGDGGNDAQGAMAAKGKVARLPPPTQWRQKGRSQGSLRPHSGGRQVAISRANTRPSSLAQCQDGVPVFDTSPSTPYWRGVGRIAARSLLGGARQPAERTRCAHGRGTSAASFSRSSNGES